MDYKQALEFIYGSVDYERFLPPVTATHYDLGRFRELLQRLGNPQDSFRSVHIAGSKGKGSVAHYLAGILAEADYHTGLYTSPHLCTPRERIRLNGAPLSLTEFAAAAEEVAAAFEGANRDDYRTVFEILSAMAFCTFRRYKVDIAVVEAGLGGRLDATNVLKPLLGIITPIVLEHTDVLGRTLAEIAGEKAGILKQGMELLLAKQSPSAAEVVKSRAQETGVTFHFAGELVHVGGWESTMAGEGFHLHFVGQPGSRLEVLTRGWGKPKVEAVRLATAASLLLCKHGFAITNSHIVSAISATRIPGRIEPVMSSPLVVADVAHHPIAIGQLCRALAARGLDRVIWVFGVNRDKGWHTMLNRLSLQGEEMHLCAANTPRAVDAQTLADGISHFSGTIVVHNNVAEAVRSAIGNGRMKDLPVAITGSFYVAGEALQELGLCE